MKRAIKAGGGLLLLAALWLLPAAPARADVYVERAYKGPLPGLVGTTELNEKVWYQGGTLKRREPTTEMRTTKIKLWGSAKKAEITRLDKDLFWYVDYAEEAYTEEKLQQLKQQADAQMAEMESGGGDDAQSKDEKPKKRIVRNEIKVEKTGEKKDINGFPTEHYVLTWLIETEDVETKEHDTTLYTADLWNTADDNAKVQALRREQDQFDRNMARKLGLEMTPERSMQLGYTAIAGSLEDTDADTRKEMEKVARELEKIKGYPILTEITIQVPEEQGGGSGDSGDKKEDKDLMGQAVGSLMKFIGDKKEKPEKGKEGMVVAFESSFEIKSIDPAKIKGDMFLPPKGFKKVKEL